MAFKLDEIFEYILINYRWVFVCLFLLPASFVFDLWMYLRNWIVFHLSSAPKLHGNRVKYVQKQVRNWIRNGKKQKLCTARPGWQTMSFRRPTYKNNMRQIKVNFVDILEINEENRTVLVEPQVTMGQLTATLNPLGWTIPVVPEIDDLTVSGLVMGTGIESSSHQHGLFQHICLMYEVVLSDGSVVECTASENADLFYSIPWSYGTLGFLTAVRIRLVPAKKFVQLIYHPLKGIDEICMAMEAASASPDNEFVEMLVFNRDEAVLMQGIQVDKAEPTKINRIGRWFKPWFFLHVKSKLTTCENHTEYIPLRDYYHRHTRSIFWELQDIIPFGNHPVFRFLFGWAMPPKVALLKLTQTSAIKRLYENHHVLQDMLVPIDTLKRSIELFHEIFNVYPLWLCPFKLPNHSGLVHPPQHLCKKDDAPLYVDIGVYGVPKSDGYMPETSTRIIENFVAENNGFQMLYADTYMTRIEFRRMFDHQLYDQVRKQFDSASAFVEVYDKVNRNARD